MLCRAIRQFCVQTLIQGAEGVAIVLLVALGVFRPVLRAQTPSIALFSPEKAELYAVPSGIRQVQGKYPSSVALILWKKDCKSDGSTNFDTQSTYSIIIAAPGLSTTGSPTAIGCKLTTTLAIDAAAASSGYYIINVTGTPNDKTKSPYDAGHAVIALMDSAAGPIPSSPQVDVIWSVLSKQLCKDNFGKHVADHLYCIELKIGNNSGHALQLAGVGFRPPEKVANSSIASVVSSNVSYQSVRASAQAYEVWTARNLFLNGTSSLGIIMAAFNPFFHNAWSVARWTAGTAVVGTAFPSALSRMSVDPTLTELNNLDDQSFRDGKLIPNNTQIRTMVFVDKEMFSGFGKAQYIDACNAAHITCPSDGPGDDPIAVKLALGHIIIVGDMIDYIQRVVVDPNVTSQEVTPGPTPTQVQATAGQDSLTAQFSSPVTDVSNVAAKVQSSTDPSVPIPLTLDKNSSTSSKLVFKLPTGKTFSSSATYDVQFTMPDGKTYVVPKVQPK